VLDALAGEAALFFRSLSDRVGAASGAAIDDPVLAAALWELVWAGRLTNDTLAPLRALTAGSGAHRARRTPPRSRYARAGRPRLPSRTGPPTTAGRWSLLPELETDPTRRAATVAETLLERHGVVTRGAVVAERVEGGFAAAYRVLSAFEDTGRCRRGYVVEGLGAAQFATPGAVDRLRATVGDRRMPTPALVLAATDPANAYGAALAWPERAGAAAGHRPGRKAGALVVTVDGELVVYVERGGRTLLSFVDDPAVLQPAADALALAVHAGQLGRLQVERADGAPVNDSPLASALTAAGFHPTPRGLRLRG
jgi:ATP-dependent Lhr-like helicase